MDKEKLITENTDIKVESLDPVGEGWDSSAYLLNQKDIVKFPNREESKQRLLIEAQVLKYLQDIYFTLSPKLIYIYPKGEFLIMGKINGKAIEGIELEKQTFQSVLTEVAKSIFQLAANNTFQAGLLELETDEPLNNRFKHIRSQNNIYSQYLKAEELDFVEQSFSKSQDFTDRIKAFCHNDISLNHVFVNDNELSGIIDWADAKLSDPAYEFGRLLRETLDLDIITKCLSTFSIDNDFIERVKLYAILSTVEDIVDGHNNNNIEYAKSHASRIATLKSLSVK